MNFFRPRVFRWLWFAWMVVGWSPGAEPSASASAIIWELAGFHTRGSAAWVVIADRTTKEVSPWLKVGQTWREFRVDRIGADGQEADLVRGTERRVVTLRRAQVGAAPRGPEGFNLLRGTVTKIEGTWVYSEDAVVQFGHAVLSALTGVMEVEGNTIRGHLSLEAVDGRSIEADEATARYVDGRPVLVVGKVGLLLSEK